MIPLDDICLRCSLFVLLCSTTLAAPGGLGSFAGSSASAFSSANANAQASSIANAVSSLHTISSADTFVSAKVPSNNRGKVNDELAHHPSISTGTGSYGEDGNNKPNSDKFGLTQVSDSTGNYNDDKSHVPCSLHQNKEDKLEKGEQGDYDEQNKETEEESEEKEESENSYDDGQYRPEHHYYGDANKKHEQTVSGIHKIEDNHPYDYDQESIDTAGGYGSKTNNYAGSIHSQTKDSPHLISSWTDVNKQTGTGQVNAGIPVGVVAPNLSSHNKDGSTNAGTFSVTGDKTNLDSTSGTNGGCSSITPGSNCGASSTGSGQSPIKLAPSDIVQTPNVPVFGTEISRDTIRCNNNYNGNCGNASPNGIGQYPSVSGVGNKPSLNQQSTEQWTGAGNKPTSLDQQSNGQWTGAGNKPSSLDQQSNGQWTGAGNTQSSLNQQNTGQWTGAGNKPSSLDQQSTGQWAGAGNKPSSLDQQSNGQWTGAGNTQSSSNQQNTGQWTGAGNKPSSLDQQSTGQWTKIPGSVVAPNLSSHNKDGSTNAGTLSITGEKTNWDLTSGTNRGCSSITPGSKCGTGSTDSDQGPIKLGPSDIAQTPNVPVFGTDISRDTVRCSNNYNGNCGNAKPNGIGQYPSVSGAGNNPFLNQQNTGQWTGAGNKPSTLDQQSTGQWAGAGNKPSSLDQQSNGQWTGAGNTQSSLNQQNTGQWTGAGNKPSTLDQQSTGQWVGAGNKPSSLNQQNTGQWTGAGNKPSTLDQQSTGQWVGAGNKPSSLNQQNTGQWTGAGNKPSSLDQQSTGQWAGAGNKPQNGIGVKQPIGSGNCGTFGGNSCTSNIGYPGSTGTIADSVGQNFQGQMHVGNAGDGHVDKNIYQVNAGNPFLYGMQGKIPALMHTTTSPVQVPSHTTGIVKTTSKPIGLGNPFLDGTLGISNTYGMQNINADKSDHNIVVTTTESINKPIGIGNPFLIHGHKHNKGDSPIYNIPIPIGGTHHTSTLPSVTTTIKPTGIANPFFQPSGGKVTDNLPQNGHSDGIKGDKSTDSGSGTTYPANPVQSSPTDKDSIHYPKAGNAETGIPPSEIHKNINSGVKGGAHHNKPLESNANSNAGVLATGNVNEPNIHGAHNGHDNVGLNDGSLTGSANNPINSLSNVLGSYDHKVTPQTSGNGGFNNDKATSESNTIINGNNANNQYTPQVANGAALSLANAGANTGAIPGSNTGANAVANAVANAGANAGASAGSYSSAFSSSQASSSSFAASQSASYSASGDLSGIMQGKKETWPFDIPGNINLKNTWSKAASQASAFAANSSGRLSESHPVGVKAR